MEKNNDKNFSDSVIMLRFGNKKGQKKNFRVQKTNKNLGDFYAYNIVISKLIEKKNSSKYLIEYLDKVIRQLVFATFIFW